jgi:single-strand DNA-binding protein
MKDINVVSMTGHLVADIDVKYSTSGNPIGKFTLAVSRNQKKNDKWEEVPSFFECAMFGKGAESLAQYLVKGKQVAISAEARQERWTHDGQNFSRVVFVVDSIALMGSKDKAPVQKTQTAGPENFDDDQIPF